MIHGERSFYKGKAPVGVPKVTPLPPAVSPTEPATLVTAKTVSSQTRARHVKPWPRGLKRGGGCCPDGPKLVGCVVVSGAGPGRP